MTTSLIRSVPQATTLKPQAVILEVFYRGSTFDARHLRFPIKEFGNDDLEQAVILEVLYRGSSFDSQHLRFPIKQLGNDGKRECE
ncbi:hypothetical protein CXF74_10890 [Psychromonas sp. Urea-02u-13]|nr:hypothetical protein CXF74_10890 [Psychromonas sp. Urea-02u-13]